MVGIEKDVTKVAGFLSVVGLFPFCHSIFYTLYNSCQRTYNLENTIFKLINSDMVKTSLIYHAYYFIIT